MPSASWTEAQAEAHLRSLELFGMRFGLDRMRRMMTVLGSPQQRYDCIHVLGTNGKTSTTRMTAAILQRHGLRTATYTSPHLISYRERLQIGERDQSGERFAAAIERAAWAAERVNRTLAGDDHVTQFELLTAAALWEIAEQDVDVAVIEAGLGGRYDATSVIDAKVTALTNVSLEHTRWLGPTVHDIAEEKLAVLAPGATLALGDGLVPDALEVAERVAAERGATIVVAPRVEASASPDSASQTSLAAKGIFQQRNFALARLVAETYLRDVAIEPSEAAIAQAAVATEVRGRLQIVARDPLTVLDGAHNPAAVGALVESLRACSKGARSRSCSACSRTRTPCGCSSSCSASASLPGSPRRQASERSRRPRCSHSRASSASPRCSASRVPAARSLRPRTGRASVTRPCSRRALSTSSATC